MIPLLFIPVAVTINYYKYLLPRLITPVTRDYFCDYLPPKVACIMMCVWYNLYTSVQLLRRQHGEGVRDYQHYG